MAEHPTMVRAQQFFDNGQYELALVEYRKLYEEDKKSAVLNYEMAAAHYYLENFDKSQSFAKAAMKETSETGVQAAILLGAIYDAKKQHKKSMKVYKKATETYGDYYLLWYNYGVTANGIGAYDKAAEAFGKSALNRLDHGSSHLALGTVYSNLGRRAEALVSLYFFLLLEPNGDRANTAWNTIDQLWEQGVKREADGDINMSMSMQRDPEAIPGSELMINMLQASMLGGEDKDGKMMPRFQSLIRFLNEADLGERNDIYTNYYLPFFESVVFSEHMDAFAHYVQQQRVPTSAQWVVSHTEELEAFFDWLDTLQ